jgi:hypothetical protein
MENHIGDIDSV